MKPTAHQNDQQSVVGSSAKEITSNFRPQLKNDQYLDAYLGKLEVLAANPDETFFIQSEDYSGDAA